MEGPSLRATEAHGAGKFGFLASISINKMLKFQRILALFVWIITFCVVHAEITADELPDLTGGVIPLLYSDPRAGFGAGGQLFSGGRLSSRGEAVYLVRVKNQSGDPIEGDSLIVVVHRIQEAARLRDVTTELEVVDSDGNTSEGKPYFRVPLGDKSELEPYGESEEFTIEIRNPNLLRLYPPVLRVRGVRRTPSQAFQDTLQHAGPKDELSPEEEPVPIE